MPIPASDAIATDIGHGARGVRYGLRPFRELQAESAAQRHLWVDFRPRKLMASGSWTADGSGLYHQACSQAWDVYTTLIVVGVKTPTEVLTFVEPGSTIAAGQWTWDGVTLYVHLTSDADPADTSVVAELLVPVSTHGVHQPVILKDRLTNGSMEAWTGPVPTGWSHSEGTGVTLDKTASDPIQGGYAARWTFTSATGQGNLWQDFTTLFSAVIYRVSGAYRNTNPSIEFRLYVWDTISAYVLSDGRCIGSAHVFGDSSAPGVWKRFSFDFICPSWTTVRVQLQGLPTGTQSGTLDIDDVKLQPLSWLCYYLPLISGENLPTLEAARSDTFWGEQSSSIGSLTIANNHGLWGALLCNLDWIGADAVIRVGGKFLPDGNEIPFEDCPVLEIANVAKVTLTDSTALFDLTSGRDLLMKVLPLRTYNNNAGTDAYHQPDRGRSRPMLWGFKAGIRPVQYDITFYSSALVPTGKYEVVDCTDWSEGIQEIGHVVWYVSDEAATVRRESERFYRSTGYGDISLALATGRFTANYDEHPIVIDQENNKLIFDIDGANYLTAAVTPGIYPMSNGYSSALDLTIQAAMRAVGGGNETCVLTLTSGKITIGRPTGTINLRCQSGSDTQTGLWAVLGFNAATDRTGQSSYTGDEIVVFDTSRMVIRCDADGYIDTDMMHPLGSGFYTGISGASIQRPGDITHHILQNFLQVDVSRINVASFVAARTTTWGAKACSLYLGTPGTVASTVMKLETSGDFDLVLSGGIWSCVPRDDSVPAGTPELVDADYLSFESRYEPEDLYQTVTLTYNESPDGGDPLSIGPKGLWPTVGRTPMGEVTTPSIGLRFGRTDSIRFATCLKNIADAAYPYSGSRLEALALQAQTPRRRFRFAVKGKCMLTPLNGKIVLNRTRAIGSSGTLSDVLVRVISKRDNLATWVSEIEAVEVL